MSAERLRALLVLAGVGAVVVVVRFFSTWVELGGVVAIVIATVLTAPAPAEPEAQLRWWRLLGIGAAISVVALPLSLWLETVGGLLAGAGGALVIIGVAFGWPAARR